MTDQHSTPPADVVYYRPWVRDRRTVSMEVEDVPDLATPGGRHPIKPENVELRYDIATREVVSIVVGGPRTDGTLERGRWVKRVKRRVEPANAPSWLRALIEEFRP